VEGTCGEGEGEGSPTLRRFLMISGDQPILTNYSRFGSRLDLLQVTHQAHCGCQLQPYIYKHTQSANSNM